MRDPIRGAVLRQAIGDALGVISRRSLLAFDNSYAPTGGGPARSRNLVSCS